MGSLILAPCVEGELWDIWRFIAKDNPDAATRVIEAADKAFELLIGNPSLGQARKYRNPRLEGVRFLPVPGFANYLIFYRASPDGLEILHVCHGARDLERLFEVD